MVDFKIKEFSKCKKYIEEKILYEIIPLGTMDRLTSTSWLYEKVLYGNKEYRLYFKKDNDFFCKILLPIDMKSTKCDFDDVICYSGDRESLKLSFVNKKDGLVKEQIYKINNNKNVSDINASCSYNEYDDSENKLFSDNMMLIDLFSKDLSAKISNRLTSRVNSAFVERDKFSTKADIIICDTLTDGYFKLKTLKEISDDDTSIIEIAECLKDEYLIEERKNKERKIDSI